jgi:tRNA threonylcarbamoyladenosine biosynthesis protein TsaE
MKLNKFLKDENETIKSGAFLAKYCLPPYIIYLQGNLGAGKTTFVRGFLQNFGFLGKVKSPTFTLVEEYRGQYDIFHFDLYRLEEPEELEQIGIREYFTENAIVLIEWPDKGVGYLPPPDMILELEISEAAKDSDEGRNLSIELKTDRAKKWQLMLEKDLNI